MEFYQTENGRLGLRQIPPLEADLLRQIPHCLQGETEAIEARFFPFPSIAAEEEELREDWKAHVEPELHEHFLSARQTVEADLRSMIEEDDLFSFEISERHIDAWLNALNQARLALAEQHGFTEKELSQHHDGPIANEKDLVLHQMELYAGLQSVLLRVLGF